MLKHSDHTLLFTSPASYKISVRCLHRLENSSCNPWLHGHQAQPPVPTMTRCIGLLSFTAAVWSSSQHDIIHCSECGMCLGASLLNRRLNIGPSLWSHMAAPGRWLPVYLLFWFPFLTLVWPTLVHSCTSEPIWPVFSSSEMSHSERI